MLNIEVLLAIKRMRDECKQRIAEELKHRGLSEEGAQIIATYIAFTSEVATRKALHLSDTQCSVNSKYTQS